jgi:hypothetical protein
MTLRKFILGSVILRCWSILDYGEFYLIGIICPSIGLDFLVFTCPTRMYFWLRIVIIALVVIFTGIE